MDKHYNFFEKFSNSSIDQDVVEAYNVLSKMIELNNMFESGSNAEIGFKFDLNAEIGFYIYDILKPENEEKKH